MAYHDKAESNPREVVLQSTMLIQTFNNLNLTTSIKHTSHLNGPTQSSRDFFGFAIVSIYQNRTNA